MPFGISVAPEEFQRRTEQELADLPGVVAVHDMILWGEGDSDGEGETSHDERVKLLLQRCREKGINLNKEKKA